MSLNIVINGTNFMIAYGLVIKIGTTISTIPIQIPNIGSAASRFYRNDDESDLASTLW